jgi:hypothetical protein
MVQNGGVQRQLQFDLIPNQYSVQSKARNLRLQLPGGIDRAGMKRDQLKSELFIEMQRPQIVVRRDGPDTSASRLANSFGERLSSVDPMPIPSRVLFKVISKHASALIK